MSELSIIPTRDYDEAEIKARSLDLPTFNRYRHVFVQVDTEKGITLSVDFNGTPVTLALIPRNNGSPECIDVKVHHREGKRTNVNGIDVPVQNAIMFKDGKSQRIDGDLLTILVHPDHNG